MFYAGTPSEVAAGGNFLVVDKYPAQGAITVFKSSGFLQAFSISCSAAQTLVAESGALTLLRPESKLFLTGLTDNI